MGLLAEYPYICSICKYLASVNNYGKLIETLKIVIERHSKTLLEMNKEEINIFLEIVLKLITMIHTESRIELEKQEFDSSKLNHLMLLCEIILKHETLNILIRNKLKIEISTMIIVIYFDYSQFKKYENMIHKTIDLAQKYECYFLLIKLITIHSNYVICLADDNKQLIIDIDNILFQILIKNETKLPKVCDLFLRFLQIMLRMRFNENAKAGMLLIETTNDLFKYIDNDCEFVVHQIGEKKRKLQWNDNDQKSSKTHKRQKLNNGNANNYIMDADICMLINFCAFMNLLWIVRNASFESKDKKLGEICENIRYLMQTTDNNATTHKLSFFELEIISFFRKHNRCKKSNIYSLVNEINGKYFTRKIVPLLKRVNAMHCNENSELLKHIRWLNMSSLPSVIQLLFKLFDCLHCGKMADANVYIEKIINIMPELQSKNDTDFGLLNFKFFIWNICTYLSLCNSDSNINKNIIEIAGMICNNESIKMLLKHGDGTQSKLKPASFSADKLNELKMRDKSNLFMKRFAENIRNGDILNVSEIKLFLRMTAIKLHYLSAHISLIFGDRKCTRNQVKRAHRLTIKNVDVSSRFYTRLILEILRYDTMDGSKKNINIKQEIKQIKSIYNCIKSIFGEYNISNTLNVLPFVALCCIYVYLSVTDEAILAFGHKANKNKKDDMIKRRVTFLKFMMNCILKEGHQQSYLRVIFSILTYLYKLMTKCSNKHYYKQDLENIEQILTEWSDLQMDFINKQFSDCVVIKDINNECIKSISFGSRSNVINVTSNNDQNINQLLKKVIVNYYDHIHVDKPSSK